MSNPHPTCSGMHLLMGCISEHVQLLNKNIIFLFDDGSHCLLSKICRFNPTNDGTVYAASSDGTISCTDLETGISLSLMNLNPDGWQVYH